MTKRLYLCLRGEPGETVHREYEGGKIIVADNELEAVELYKSFRDDQNGIYPDRNVPIIIRDITDKLQTSTVLYDDGCR